MDAAGVQVEALRRMLAVAGGEPVPPVPAEAAEDVKAAIHEEFAIMHEAARRAAKEWCLAYVQGQLARVLLASAAPDEDAPAE